MIQLRFIIAFFLCLFGLLNAVYAATGNVAITSNTPTVVVPNTSFTVSGTYVLQSDSAPAATYNCGIYSIAPPVFSASYWDWMYWSGEYAQLRYSIDGVDKGVIGSVGYTRGFNPTNSLGKILNFQVPVNTWGMALGSSHQVSIDMQDIYGIGCYYVGWYLSWGRALGGTIAIATHTFTIASPKPSVSLILGKPSLTGCESETAYITVTSNDPTAQGGTVTLTFPNGTTASAPFAGKTATLTFANFGFPNGYMGRHKAGDILTFTVKVTTPAGGMATASATANVIMGGLKITMTPHTALLEPHLQDRSAITTGGIQQPSARKQDIQIKVLDPSGAVVLGAQVNASLELFPGAETFGGHDHGVHGRPLSTLGSLTPIKEINGTYNTTYSSSIYASKSQIRVTATDPATQCTGELVSGAFVAQVSGLKPISGSLLLGNGRLVGGTCNHHGPSDTGAPQSCQNPNNNHYLRQSSLNNLLKLQQAWEKTYVNNPKYGYGSLRINDASLPKGGKFEVFTLWGSSWVSHKTHRRGVDVDIGIRDTANMNSVTKKKLDALNSDSPVQLFRLIKDETDKFHMHVYLE